MADHLDDRERRLHPKIVVFWRLATFLWFLVPITATTVGAAMLGRAGWLLVVAVVAAGIGTTLWYPPARYARWRWRLTDLAVELEHGVLIRTAESLPYFRIQQIDINQGPVDRLLGLASLEVTSASASGSVRLPAIDVVDAQPIRRALLERANAAVGQREGGVSDAV